jgi:hypothetical protein
VPDVLANLGLARRRMVARTEGNPHRTSLRRRLKCKPVVDDRVLMTNNMRKAIRGRVAIVILATAGLAGLLGQQTLTKPEPIDRSIYWRLETLTGQHVHVNLDAVQLQGKELLKLGTVPAVEGV